MRDDMGQARWFALWQERVGENAARQTQAFDALLAMLWVQTGRDRLTTACVLCGYAPDTPDGNTPPLAERLVQHLKPLNRADAGSQATMLPANLPFLPSPPPAGPALRQWAQSGLSAVLTECTTALRILLNRAGDVPMTALHREASACLDALLLASHFVCEELAAGCGAVLMLVASAGEHAESAEGQTQNARLAIRALLQPLKEAACLLLAMPLAECRRLLYPLLLTKAAGDHLLPVLDYVRDPVAVPRLMEVLRSRTYWSETEETLLWSVVGVFGRVRDRRALPLLRQIAGSKSFGLHWGIQGWTLRTGYETLSPELRREARRIVVEIEGGGRDYDQATLLRASTESDQGRGRDELLRAALHSPAGSRAEELLREAHEPNSSGESSV